MVHRADIRRQVAQRLTAAVAASAEGIVLFGPEGKVDYANHAAQKILGTSEADLIGKRSAELASRLLANEDRPPAETDDLVGRSLATGRPILGVERVLRSPEHPEGLVLSASAMPIFEDDRLSGAALSLTDISNQVRSQKVLRASEERYRSIVENRHEVVFTLDLEGHITYISPTIREITDYAPEEVAGRDFIRFVHPQDLPVLQDSLAGTLRGQSEPAEFRAIGKNGDIRWIQSTSMPRFEDGQLVGIVGIIADITERKSAEDQIRLEASLLDQVRNAVVMTDLGYRTTYMNRFAQAVLGWPLEEARGKDVSEVIALPRGKQRARDIGGTVVRGGHWEGEVTIRRRDGSVFPGFLSASLVRDNRGSSIGMVCVIVDVTELEAAHKAIEEKDLAIRRAYVDVVGAVTGGKLVLMTHDELTSTLGRPMAEPRHVLPNSLSESRHQITDAVSRLGPTTDPKDVALAAGEALTNVLKHAGGGTWQLFETDNTMQVVVTDHGPGIDFRTLPKATLMAGFSTKHSLGMGFAIMLDVSDRLLLATQPGRTMVCMEIQRARSLAVA